MASSGFPSWLCLRTQRGVYIKLVFPLINCHEIYPLHHHCKVGLLPLFDGDFKPPFLGIVEPLFAGMRAAENRSPVMVSLRDSLKDFTTKTGKLINKIRKIGKLRIVTYCNGDSISMNHQKWRKIWQFSSLTWFFSNKFQPTLVQVHGQG